VENAALRVDRVPWRRVVVPDLPRPDVLAEMAEVIVEGEVVALPGDGTGPLRRRRRGGNSRESERCRQELEEGPTQVGGDYGP